MRILMIALGVFTTAALACVNPSGYCGGCGKEHTTLVETVTYALNELGLEENSDIHTALRLYQKEMRSLSRKVPVEAFSDGKFHPGLYAQKAGSSQAVQAQIDLFETIYLILNDEQKKEFPKLMGMYQHHIQYALPSKGYGCASGGYGAQCDIRSPRNCGSKNAPLSPAKKAAPVKR